MRQFLDSFNAKEDRVVQILNLGAGSDTRYFQFKVINKIQILFYNLLHMFKLNFAK